MSLADKIHATIAHTGAMSVAEYMAQCLFHPSLGYYTRKTGFGVAGDFTTAPEISQVFGELLGLSLAQSWQEQGGGAFVLAELGGGSGQLMVDVLRAARGVAGFVDSAQIYMVEGSAALREAQQNALADYPCHWCDSIADLPDMPLFLIANEFFDCLPISQYQKKGAVWHERMVTSDGTGEDAKLSFCLGRPVPNIVPNVVPNVGGQTGTDNGNTFTDLPLTNLPDDSVLETCPPASAIAETLARHIAEFGGTAIIVDYGRWGNIGATLQAVRDHKKTNPLTDAGMNDISALVDFRALARAVRPFAQVSALVEQGVLLERLGIAARMERLAIGLTGEGLASHITAHKRLTHADEMGSLFKAIAITAKGAALPAGFEYDGANGENNRANNET